MLEQRTETQLRQDVDRLKQENQALLAEATGQITSPSQANQGGVFIRRQSLLAAGSWQHQLQQG